MAWMNQGFWDRMTRNLGQAPKSRDLLIPLALFVSFIGLVLLVIGRASWAQSGQFPWAFDLGAVFCVVIAILIRILLDGHSSASSHLELGTRHSLKFRNP
jgi:membrane protein implicated in regulation of membrane protease activity